MLIVRHGRSLIKLISHLKAQRLPSVRSKPQLSWLFAIARQRAL
jgi:hypothetical protein